MTASVFISYSNLDRPVAEALCTAIEASGTRCWIAPRDISPSREWAEEIIDGINGAQVMLLVFSSRSNGSPQVRREIERAIHKEVPVIPFRIENVAPTKSLEYFLSSQHWFDAFDETLDAYLPRLCHLLTKLCLNRPAASNADTPRASGIGFSGNPYGERNEATPVPPVAATVAPAVVTPVGVPAVASSPPAAFEFAAADLGVLESQLAVHIGPIAHLLVRRAAARSHDKTSLIESLANELDLPQERTAFTTACRQILR